MKMMVTITAKNSATTIDSQIPITFFSGSLNNIGKIKTAATWKSKVLKNDIIADTGPLFNDVKKDEPKMAIPEKRKEKE